MFISELNLKDISSGFVEALEGQDVELPTIFYNILFDFNSRNINPKNFNNMIRLLDYLNIQDTSQFILKHSQPTFELYAFEEDNQNKFQIPQFMTSNNWNTGMSKDNLKKYLCRETSKFNLPKWILFFFQNQIIDSFCLLEILKGGSQECLEIAVQNGATLNTKHYFYIQNLDSLQYIHQHQVPWKRQSSYDTYTECVYYTRMGLVDCLQYAHLNGSEWSSALCVDAARYSFECLKYAIDNGCPINNTDICKQALRYKQLDCFYYAVEHGAPIDSFTLNYGCTNLDVLQYIFKNKNHLIEELTSIHQPKDYMSRIIRFGEGDCLKYAHQHGFPLPEKTALYAALYGHLDILQYSHQHGFIMSVQIATNAARRGQYQCLKYILDNGCPLDGTICEQAAMFGHLQCLHLAHKKGCPMTKNICTMSIFRDSAQCLKYAHQHGAKLTSRTFYLTARDKHQKCFKYLYQHQCPITKLTRKIAIRNQYLKIRKKSSNNY